MKTPFRSRLAVAIATAMLGIAAAVAPAPAAAADLSSQLAIQISVSLLSATERQLVSYTSAPGNQPGHFAGKPFLNGIVLGTLACLSFA